jgi:hypothetical protein
MAGFFYFGDVMKRLLFALLAVAVLLGTVAGCDNSANKNVNSARDRPRAE